MVNIVEHERTVNIEKKTWKRISWFSEVNKKVSRHTSKKNNLQEVQKVQVKLDCI